VAAYGTLRLWQEHRQPSRCFRAQGCFSSSPSAAAGAEKTSEVELFGLPAPWKSDRPLTQEALERKRDEFWLTNGSGAYGGQPGTLGSALLTFPRSLSLTSSTRRDLERAAGGCGCGHRHCTLDS
jgi:hypothetical protein